MLKALGYRLLQFTSNADVEYKDFPTAENLYTDLLDLHSVMKYTAYPNIRASQQGTCAVLPYSFLSESDIP